MRFMVLIKANADYEAGKMPSPELLTALGKFNEELVQAGVLLGVDALHPSSQGVRLHYANGQHTVTDGPFAETKELVAGYWLWQCPSKAEAIEWLKRSPIPEGEVEIRQLFETADFPVDPAEQEGGWREKEEQQKSAPPPARKPGTKRYMGLLKADKDSEAGALPDEKLLSAMGAFIEEGLKRGIFLGGEGLQPSSQGARVRFAGNQRTVIDGPFTETKELVAGYAILQFASKAEAIDWTKRFVQVDAPGRSGAASECELRPIFEPEDFGAALMPHLKAPEDRLRPEV